MRQERRSIFGFAIPASSSLLLLTAICAAFLAAEPPAGRAALRQFESKVVKAKTILHHLSSVKADNETAQLRTLLEDLLEVEVLDGASSSASNVLIAPAEPSAYRSCLSSASFQRPPPVRLSA